MSVIDTITLNGSQLLGVAWTPVWTLVKILCVLLPLMGLVAYATLWERKLIGWIQIRVGPNRVGPAGLLQPIADAVKLIFKEIVVPTKANGKLFILGPIMTIMPALAAWCVVPFGPQVALANVNAGLLLLMAITSIEVYGIIIAGWASNSKYSFLGAMRASAQMISYEIPMGFVFVVILMISGSLNFSDIVAKQEVGYFVSHGVNILSWNWLPLLPPPVRRRRRRVGNRGRPHGRVFGHVVRDVHAGRVRQHDPDRLHRVDHVPRRLVGTVRLPRVWRRVRRLLLAVRQNLLHRLAVRLGARYVPTLPFRPDHAPRLESIHSAHAGVAGPGRRRDADVMEYLEIIQKKNRERRKWNELKIFSAA
jgi:hypothetical protein